MRSFHLPRLSRRGKIARNLALATALVLALWVGTERGSWTVNGALRRMEQDLLLGPGQTIYTQRGGSLENETWAMVLGDSYAYTGVVRGRDLGRSFWSKTASVYQAISLEGEPGLLSLSSWGLLGQQQESWRLFCPNGPEGAGSAVLTVSARCRWEQEDSKPKEGTLRFQGTAQAQNGVFAFVLQADTPEEASALFALMGGLTGNCEVLQADYQMDFATPSGAPAGHAEGVLI